MTRLEMIARTAQLVMRNIEAHKGNYNGGMVPNVQSIIDLCVLDVECTGAYSLMFVDRTDPVFSRSFCCCS